MLYSLAFLVPNFPRSLELSRIFLAYTNLCDALRAYNETFLVCGVSGHALSAIIMRVEGMLECNELWCAVYMGVHAVAPYSQ